MHDLRASLLTLLFLLASLTGCDAWASVEVHNALDVDVTLRASADSRLRTYTCYESSADGSERSENVSAPIAPDDTICVLGPNRGMPYAWAEVPGFLLSVEREGVVCAEYDGAALDAQLGEGWVLEVDELSCPAP